MSEDVFDYVKKAKGNDMSDEQIRQELLRVGWPSADIEEAFKEVGELESIFTASSSSISEEDGVKKKKAFKLPVFKIIAAIIVVLLLGGGAFGLYSLGKQLISRSASPEPVSQDQQQDQIQTQEQPLSEQKLTMEEALKGALKCGMRLMDNITETDQVMCFENIFRKYDGSDICVKIDQSSMGDLPEDRAAVDGGSCYAGMAIAKNDEDLCSKKGGHYSGICGAIIAMGKNEKAPEEQLSQCGIQAECYAYLFNQKGYDENLCDNIEYKNDCYTGLALSKKDEAICSKIESETGKSSCFADLGELKGDENLCAKAMSQDPKAIGSTPEFLNSEGDRCYSNIAVSEKEPALCGKIKDLDAKNLCYLEITVDGQDPSSCASVNQKIDEVEAKDMCYLAVAFKKEDDTLCGSAGFMKDLCYAGMSQIKLDENLCEQSGTEKDFCYFYLAKLKDDENICDKAGSRMPDCYFYMAKAKDDENICVKSGVQSAECYFYIAGTKKDENLCLKISESDKTGYSQSNCYLALGAIKSDESLCKIGKEKAPAAIPEYCFRSVAVAKGDYNICESVDIKYGARYVCYTAVAKSTKNETLCEKNSAAYKPQCYYEVAVAKEDETLCEKAGTSKTICYSKIAVIKKDMSLCAKAGTYKITCEKEVGE